MNVYELSIGNTHHFIAAADEQDAYKQGTDPEAFPDIHYLPFTITQIVVPGHTITVTKDEDTTTEPVEDEFTAMERPELIAFVKEHEIEHKHNWGAARLRDAARAWKAAQ